MNIFISTGSLGRRVTLSPESSLEPKKLQEKNWVRKNRDISPIVPPTNKLGTGGAKSFGVYNPKRRIFEAFSPVF